MECFEELNRERELREEPLFANPRNAASGTLKSQNSAVVASRKLDAYLYYLLGDNLPHDGHYEIYRRQLSGVLKSLMFRVRLVPCKRYSTLLIIGM